MSWTTGYFFLCVLVAEAVAGFLVFEDEIVMEDDCR